MKREFASIGYCVAGQALIASMAAMGWWPPTWAGAIPLILIALGAGVLYLWTPE